MAAARAVENHIVWVSANQTGTWGAVRFLGNAQVVDADGVVQATPGGRAGLAVAHVDVEGDLADLRARIDHLGDRRPAAYGAAPRRAGRAANG